MNGEMMALARRAVACAAWRWMPGMRHTTTIKGEEWFCCRVAEKDAPREPRHPDALPDLDDPATLGCLIALVREALGDPTLTTVHDGVEWKVYGWRFHGATEAEALVMALESAVQP